MNIQNTDVDYSVIHHSAMLSDAQRLVFFKEALKKVISPSDSVVDIGTGTGILAAYAATMTKNSVYAIEYFDFAANLAKKLFLASPFSNIAILQNTSYDVCLSESPDILITETIGQIGPEENIVELCFDFCQRHSNISHIIPSKLSIYAEVINSHKGNVYVNSLISGYLSASFPGFDFQIIENDIKNQLARLIMQTDLDDAISLHKPWLLAEYQLGKSAISTFSKSFIIPKGCKEALIHFYFYADLGNNIVLSSRFNQENHWKHSFVPVIEDKTQINISYIAGSGVININWTEN
jgi:SAM-dependent methyltransferase